MRAHLRAQIARPIRSAQTAGWIPSWKIEYAFYFSIAYSILAPFLGVEVPLLAAAIMVVLACFCFKHLRSRAKQVFGPISLLLACIISFILVQIVAHGASPVDQVVRDFILWFCGMIVVQSLCLRRGFLHRCVIVFLLLGLIALPYLTFEEDELERAKSGIEIGANLANANGLGNWFGFCVVFFTIFALENKRFIVRAAAWATAIGSMFVVGLTLSRGAVLGSAVAIVFAFRVYLKRAFVPALALILLSWLVVEAGLFNDITTKFASRGIEGTGRYELWPMVIERILKSPILGVGKSDIATYMPDGFDMISTPHNTFLLVALASGVVPLAFYVAFWIGAVRRSFSRVERSELSPYRMPFLLYVFAACMVADVTGVQWALLTLSVGAGPVVVRRPDRVTVVRRIGGLRMPRPLGDPSRIRTQQ